MRIPITAQGVQKLRKQLDDLKASRSEISAAIGRARTLGDLSENADYHANKDKQGRVEAKIRVLESQLASAQVIDVARLPKTGKVVFGTTVTLSNTETSETTKYQIVGEPESDIADNKIAVTTPFAQALVSKVAGEVIELKLNGDKVSYKIENVEYI